MTIVQAPTGACSRLFRPLRQRRLAVSPTGRARRRCPARSACLGFNFFTLTKTIPAAEATRNDLAGAEGLEVASQPLLRCPKKPSGACRRLSSAFSTATPTPPSLHRPPGALGGVARHATRASGSTFSL